MSLSGSVEDLPLFEILQVVAFTQRTGYLAVKAPEGEAGIVFREGRVVAGYIWDVPPLGPETSQVGIADLRGPTPRVEVISRPECRVDGGLATGAGPDLGEANRGRGSDPPCTPR